MIALKDVVIFVLSTIGLVTVVFVSLLLLETLVNLILKYIRRK